MEAQSSHQKSGQPSIISRIQGRFRYGLVTQEILGRLSETIGLVIHPYYLVREELHPDLKPSLNYDNYKFRYLDESDIGYLTEHAIHKKSADKLIKNLRTQHQSIGFFFEDELAAYTCFRFDCTPVPIWKKDLFQLNPDEAYLYNMYVFPDYRGCNLAPLTRYCAYEELQKTGKHHLYSVTLAFNASSRRFKHKLQAREIELRLLMGIKQWKAIDIRLRAFEDKLKTPWVKFLGRRIVEPFSSS